MAAFAYLFLLIEFFDELYYTVEGSALPALRLDLALDYAQVGLLLGIPPVIGTLIEPIIMLLGDTRLRKRLIVGGGVTISLAIFLVASAHSFALVLAGFVVLFPASGAFVSLSQATLMDHHPGREPQMMARWTLAGSLGNLMGPLLLAGVLWLGLSWRWSFVIVGCLGLILALVASCQPAEYFPAIASPFKGANPLEMEMATWAATGRDLLVGLRRAVTNLHLLRWLALLQFSDLLLDVFTSYLPLYFTDVLGTPLAQTSLLMSLFLLAGLISDIILVPLLERFPGRSVVRLSAGAVAVLYFSWLLAPWFWLKVILVFVIKLTTLGWYSVLQGEAYAALPGRSGTVMALNSLGGLLGGILIGLVGFAAERLGLSLAMWLLLAGPLVLICFVPLRERTPHHKTAQP